MKLIAVAVLNIGAMLSVALMGSYVMARTGAEESTVEQGMSALFDGPPVLAETVLDPAAYVKEGVQKLANARIAYVNFEAIEEMLKELGISRLPKSLTPELAKAI